MSSDASVEGEATAKPSLFFFSLPLFFWLRRVVAALRL